MNPHNLSASELRELAHRAIAKELGMAALIRYLRDNFPGSGDYTLDRDENLPQGNVEDLYRQVRKFEKAQEH